MRIRSATFTVASFCISAVALGLVVMLSDPSEATGGLLWVLWAGIALLVWSFVTSCMLVIGWALGVAVWVSSWASLVAVGAVWTHQQWRYSDRLLIGILLATLIVSWIIGWRINQSHHHDGPPHAS